MAYTKLGRVTISPSGPTITADVYYERQRNGADMQYRFQVILNGLLYSSSSFGYNLKTTIKLDNVYKLSGGTLKNTSPAQWTTDRPAVYYPSSGWYTVSGKASGTVSLYLNIYSDNGGGVDQVFSYSLTVDPGKSVISSLPTFTIGSSSNIGITRQSSSFTHTVTYKFGSVSGNIGSSKTSSETLSWTPPLSLYLQIIGKSSGTGTITIETFSGSTSLGSNSYTLTIKAASVYNPPSISNLSYERGAKSGSDWVADPQGEDIKITYTDSVPAISGISTTYLVEIGGTTLASGSASSGNYTFYAIGIGTITTYQLKVSLVDTIGSSKTMALTISTLEVPFDLNVNLPGAAFGKIAEFEKVVQLAPSWRLDLGGNVTFENGDQTAERDIYFENKTGAHPHHCSLYGGSPNSYTGIGLWDNKNNRAVLYYEDENNTLVLGNSGGSIIRSNRRLKVLYSSTGIYLNQNQTATLTEAVSEQLNGIVLAWSYYSSSEGKGMDYDWNYFFIPKEHVWRHSGAGIDLFLAMTPASSASDTSITAKKYAYISDWTITGCVFNSANSNSNKFVLRYVYGV